MTITSVGYAGTVGANKPWADMLDFAAGNLYFVDRGGAVKVTSVAAGTRQVQISTGLFGGHGVSDVCTVAETISLPVVTSGTRWFLILARRIWGTTQKTTFEYIDAGSTTNAATPPTVLPTRNVIPGTIDDQPLALVSVTAGQTVPGIPIDLRAIGHARGYYLATSELALQYMNQVGYQIRIGSTTWRRVFDLNGQTIWEKDTGPLWVASDSVFSSSPGWAGTTGSNRLMTSRNDVQYDIQTRRTGATLTASSSTGNLLDVQVATLRGPAPDYRIPVTFDYGFYGYVSTGNILVLAGGTPGSVIERTTQSSDVSLRATIRFAVASAS